MITDGKKDTIAGIDVDPKDDCKVTTDEAGNMDVKIYDKPASYENRTKIYSGTSSERHFVFDPPKSSTHNRIYIDYIIPANNSAKAGVIDKGCVIFYSGFKH